MGSKIISIVVSIVIGVALFPVISDFIDPLVISGGTYYGTTTGSLLELLPTLVVLVLVGGTAAVVLTRKA